MQYEEMATSDPKPVPVLRRDYDEFLTGSNYSTAEPIIDLLCRNVPTTHRNMEPADAEDGLDAGVFSRGAIDFATQTRVVHSAIHMPMQKRVVNRAKLCQGINDLKPVRADRRDSS